MEKQVMAYEEWRWRNRRTSRVIIF